MQGYLSELYAGITVPLLSALLLGLLTAIAPCPMTINITAIGFIGKDLGNRKRVFGNGLFYVLGNIFSYSILGIILYLGADKFKIASLFQQYAEKIVGPLLLVTGILMLGVVRINFPAFKRLTERFRNRKQFRYRDSFLLGAVLALAFCPYSGVLYFGMLIPLTISSSAPYLPLVFSLGAGLPVVLFAWILAFTIAGIGKMVHHIREFEYWFSKAVALLFVSVGTYSLIRVWF